jgi:hypothetical protein
MLMDQSIFEGLVKDVVANLYDYAALETHPLLYSVFQPPAVITALAWSMCARSLWMPLNNCARIEKNQPFRTRVAPLPDPV